MPIKNEGELKYNCFETFLKSILES
jgi:hypothetical protein